MGINSYHIIESFRSFITVLELTRFISSPHRVVSNIKIQSGPSVSQLNNHAPGRVEYQVLRQLWHQLFLHPGDDDWELKKVMWYDRDFYRISGMNHGYSWIFRDIHGYSWIFMDIHGYSWIFMNIHGYSWIFMDIIWYPWNCGDPKRFQLIAGSGKCPTVVRCKFFVDLTDRHAFAVAWHQRVKFGGV